jgi:hypothetical protein
MWAFDFQQTRVYLYKTYTEDHILQFKLFSIYKAQSILSGCIGCVSKIRADSQVDPLPQRADRDKDGRVQTTAAVAVVGQQTLQLPHALFIDAHKRSTLVILKK